jgi:SAM-dependent methyltransferase
MNRRSDRITGRKQGRQDAPAGITRCHALPPCIEDAIERYISNKVGKDTFDPVILNRIRHAVVSQKDSYWKRQGRHITYRKGYSVFGYLAYHFPVYFTQTKHLIDMLIRDGLLGKEARILDIGTGPGVVPLAIADRFSAGEGFRAVISSLEQSEEHIEAFSYISKCCFPAGGPVRVLPAARGDLMEVGQENLPGEVDLLVFSNVLNELESLTPEKRADIVMRFAGNLAHGGSILIVEPAEELTSTGLRAVSLALKKWGLTIHSPCTFVWGTNCTPDRCWSFVTAPSIQPTRLMRALAECDEPYRYINTDIKYSYVVLRKDKRTREQWSLPEGHLAIRLSQIRRYNGRSVTVIAARMSENLGDNRTMIFRICDGSAMGPVYALLPLHHLAPSNRDLIDAPYGAVLELRGVMVRYNSEYDSYNLLVRRETAIQILKGQSLSGPANPG